MRLKSRATMNRLMQRLRVYSLFARYPVQIKFVLNGAWNTVFAFFIFIGLDNAFTHIFSRRYVAYMSAYALTNFFSVANAFILHKYLTFQSRAKGWRLVMEFIRFLCTYAFVFCLSMAIFPILVEGFHIAPKICNVICMIIPIAVTYIGHSRFSFKAKDRPR